MKGLVLLYFILISVGLDASFKAESQIYRQNQIDNIKQMNENKLKIKIGGKTFTATLANNPTAMDFRALLPLTIKMNELNNNEKYADLPKSLSISPSVPPGIQTGDLMLYGSRTLVLFYKGFSTSYSYTKIGKIEDVDGLFAALGTGDVTVSFE